MPYRNNSYSRVIPLHRSTNEPIATVELDSSMELISMDETCARLDALNVPHTRLTDFHLKIGCINHYPTTGVTMLDGKPKYPDRGFESLLHALRERHVLRSTQTTTRGSSATTGEAPLERKRTNNANPPSSNVEESSPIILQSDDGKFIKCR
jgi:hypothetical protein